MPSLWQASFFCLIAIFIVYTIFCVETWGHTDLRWWHYPGLVIGALTLLGMIGLVGFVVLYPLFLVVTN